MDYSPQSTEQDQILEVKRLRDLLAVRRFVREKAYDKFREASQDEAKVSILASLAWKDLEFLQTSGKGYNFTSQ